MDNYKDVVVSSRVRLARNAVGIPFPRLLDGASKECQELVTGVKDTAKRLYSNCSYLEMSDLTKTERQSLFEKHYISYNLMNNTATGAVIVAKEKNMSIMINEEDHIRAQCMIKGYDLDTAYKNVDAFDTELSARLRLAYSDKYGYLTSCPTNLGTGLRASVMVFLPALTKSNLLNQLSEQISNAGLTIRGWYGEGSKGIGYTYQISNQITLGLSESEIIDRVKKVIEYIAKAERMARERLHKEKGIRLEDEIMRSYGALRYAKMLDTSEFMSLIANVKLGAALGILQLNMDGINTLIEDAQPANLCRISGKELNEEERDRKRAQLVQERIVNLS